MLKLTTTQEVDAAIAPKDRLGNDAEVDGPPLWTSSDENVLIAIPSEDGLTAVIRAVGGTGPCQVSVTADADLGDGVETLTALADFEVIAGQATSLMVNLGTPREQDV